MKWNGRTYRPANAQYITKKKDFNFQEALKPYGEKELPVWNPVVAVNNIPTQIPTTPTPTPSNTPTGTPNVTPTQTGTPNPTPTNTATQTPTGTASVTPTPTNTGTPEVTPTPTQTSSGTPSPTTTPSPTPSKAQFCKKYQVTIATVGNGQTWNYTQCNNIGGTFTWSNIQSAGATFTIYSRSGAPTKSSGTGTATITDLGFESPCSGSTSYTFSTTSGVNQPVNITTCAGDTDGFIITSARSWAGCVSSYTTSAPSLDVTNNGSCAS